MYPNHDSSPQRRRDAEKSMRTRVQFPRMHSLVGPDLSGHGGLKPAPHQVSSAPLRLCGSYGFYRPPGDAHA